MDMRKIASARKSRGFTLVELLIVIIIIGILAGSMMLVAGSGTDKANATKIVSDMRTMKSAALMYYADNNTWPAAMTDFDGYLDRKTDSDSNIDYKLADGSTYTSISADLMLVGTLSGDYDTSGVKDKLAKMAEKDGLYNSTGGAYTGSATDISVIIK